MVSAEQGCDALLEAVGHVEHLGPAGGAAHQGDLVGAYAECVRDRLENRLGGRAVDRPRADLDDQLAVVRAADGGPAGTGTYPDGEPQE
jgi:hypothetical protein